MNKEHNIENRIQVLFSLSSDISASFHTARHGVLFTPAQTETEYIVVWSLSSRQKTDRGSCLYIPTYT